ncbi:MAG TPA: hypothetical protein VFS30_05925 [Dehalococcoidia bacterium]|nr:hypothetical protein [Dehalococcoidia bacterium]
MADERPMVHIRLPKELLKAVDHESVELDLDRARTIESLLRRALSLTEGSGKKMAAVS